MAVVDQFRERKMNIELLKSAYQDNEAVKAICDHMAARAQNQNETMLHRIVMHLEHDGWDFRKDDVRSALRQLESAGCGRYVIGRHGWKSRFVWAVKSQLVSAAASGIQSAESLEEDETEEVVVDEGLLEHTFWLRPDFAVTVDLPVDLTANEAQRLSDFVRALSFDE